MTYQGKNDVIRQLFDYQKVDNELKAIKNKINSTEEFRKLYHAKRFLKNAEESLAAMSARVAELNAKLEKLGADVDENVNLISEYENSIDKSEDEDELNYLTKKTDQLSRTLDAQEKEIASIISEIEMHIASFNDLGEKVPQYKEQFRENKEKYDDIKEKYSAQIESRTKLMEVIAGKIESSGGGQILEHYRKLSADGVSHPIVQLRQDGRCGGCNVELATLTLDRIKDHSFTICEHCRRIIYR